MDTVIFFCNFDYGANFVCVQRAQVNTKPNENKTVHISVNDAHI